MDYMKFRLRSFTELYPVYYLDCGSASELPTKYRGTSNSMSDSDCLSCCYDICAIPWNRNPPKNTSCTILRIDSTETPSGYARLKIDGDSTKDKTSYYRRPRMLANIPSGGAAIQSVAIYSVSTQEDQISSMDNVFAIYCPYWPVEAEEWRRRNRFHGWPNEKLIARITRGGCHFVSKLRTWSSCDDTEWRFSFSKAELLLIHSWTNVQKLVYHIIRSIKKSFAESITKYCGGDGSKGLQTYFFKTLMFWACEEFSPEFWREESIITCVETMLFRFLRCLKDKWCPSYFIPKCNIMCHLTGKGSFEEELRMIYNGLMIGSVSRACNMIMRKATKVIPLVASLEQLCLYQNSATFPINEDLNGRFSQNLVECEWFLPGMRNLHSALEAHLRLMSIDNVTSRKEHMDCIECLEHFKCASIKNEDLNSFKYFNPELSYDENFNAIWLRKQTGNSIPIYRRHLRRSFEDDADEQIDTDSLPSLLLWPILAYRANFYFTAMQSYEESLTEFNIYVDILVNKKHVTIDGKACPSILSIPVLICNSLSLIYDEHLQVILGFATLHRNVSSSESSNSSTAQEVCLKLNEWEFLKYIYIQSGKMLSAVPGITVCSCRSNLDFAQPCRPMSQLMPNKVFSAAILFAALRQSRVYTEPFKGILVPIISINPSIIASFTCRP